MNMHSFDLHIHTTYSSDGQHTPVEIMAMAHARGLTSIAFADHMEIGAVWEVRGLSEPGLEIIAGCEFSTRHRQREYHLLYYAFDADAPVLKAFLEHYCAGVWEQAVSIVERFQSQGFDLEQTDISGWGRSLPSGVTFLDALKKRNLHDERLLPYIAGEKAHTPYLSFYRDVLQTDLGEGMRARLPELIETLHQFRTGGVLILAHPGRIDRGILAELKGHGLNGIEVFSTYHDADTSAYLTELAATLDLLVSAGSDFHGERVKPGIRVGDVHGDPNPAMMRALRQGLISY